MTFYRFMKCLEYSVLILSWRLKSEKKEKESRKRMQSHFTQRQLCQGMKSKCYLICDEDKFLDIKYVCWFSLKLPGRVGGIILAFFLILGMRTVMMMIVTHKWKQKHYLDDGVKVPRALYPKPFHLGMCELPSISCTCFITHIWLQIHSEFTYEHEKSNLCMFRYYKSVCFAYCNLVHAFIYKCNICSLLKRDLLYKDIA